jgi:hypothetical protein
MQNKICSIEGCEKPLYARNLCRNHYASLQRKGFKLPIKISPKNRICSIPGCNEKHVARGYCKKHYQTHVKRSERKRRNPDRQCKIEGCMSKDYYAKGYCHNHYKKYVAKEGAKHNHLDFLCSYPGCSVRVATQGGYCAIHKEKALKGYIGIDGRSIALKGEKNINWKGGISYYPNHYYLKKQRKEKLKSVNYECQVKSPNCTQKATQTHHINGDRSDHSLDNLLAVCSKCHGWLRRGQPNKKAKYDFKLIDIAKEINYPASAISRLIKNNTGSFNLRVAIAGSSMGDKLDDKYFQPCGE